MKNFGDDERRTIQVNNHVNKRSVSCNKKESLWNRPAGSPNQVNLDMI